MLVRLGLGLGLFFGSLLLGWFLSRQGLLTDARATRIIRFVVRRLTPVVLALSFWRLDIRQPGLWVLPLVGCLISASTLLPAWGYARAAKLRGPQTGSILICAFFSNLGFFGAFVAFALFGEQAYGLATWYLVYFSPCFYSLGFAVAKRFGSGAAMSPMADRRPDELRFFPFLGMGVGLILNLLSIPRPAACEAINRLLIPVDTALYIMAIGSQVSLRVPRRWLRACVAMSVIKFWWSPLIGWGLVQLWHLEGLPRLVVLLQAATPVGVSPLMLALLFGLDRRLTNALQVFTALLAIPWMLLYLPLIR